MAYKVPRLYVKSQQVCHNLVALYECFITGQYRVLSGEMTLNACDLRELAGRKNAYMRASDVMKDLHNYGKKVLWDIYLRHLYKQMAPEWTASLERLLQDMQPLFDSGRAALIAVGKQVGMPSKTIHWTDGRKSIPENNIKHYSGAHEIVHAPTTISVVNDGSEKLPLGWAILELDPVSDCTFLQEWCANVLSPDDLWRDELKRLSEERKRLRKRDQRDAELASMSPVHRDIGVLCTELKAAPGNVGPDTELFKKVQLYLEEALVWTSADDKLKLATEIQPLMERKNMFQSEAAEVFMAQLRQLRGEA